MDYNKILTEFGFIFEQNITKNQQLYQHSTEKSCHVRVFTKGNSVVEISVAGGPFSTFNGCQQSLGIFIGFEEEICISDCWIIDSSKLSRRYPLTEEILRTVIDMQLNPSKAEVRILKSHIKNLEIIKDKFEPYLNSIDFKRDSNVCIGENRRHEATNLYTRFIHPNSSREIEFFTDCVTGDLIFMDKEVGTMSIEGFRKLINRNILHDEDGNIPLEFEYLFNEGEDINTYGIIRELFDGVMSGIKMKNEERDWKKIPERYDSLKVLYCERVSKEEGK